ncbi:cytochrome P450 family protein [Rhizobium laguerreae]|uniref:hypothetical protein n=1 Tax=Rhizobium laguerreae TaxID=1076926 RepID=UPI0021B10812|nr:hypothetical protein [Rhizobium laguerreae]
MNSRSKAVFSNARPAGFARINRASWIDTLRVVAAVVVPTAAKGVIIRRPIMERLAQRQGLDTSAVRQMQRLVRKYGRAPLLLPIPFRPELLILDPADVSTVLHCSPQPFATATWEKRAALAHFEPKNVLISDASRRAELRPIHEHALASADRLHPSSARFKTIVDRTPGDFGRHWCRPAERTRLRSRKPGSGLFAGPYSAIARATTSL